MAYLLMALLILFLTGPMMAGGIWLATLKETAFGSRRWEFSLL